MENQGDLKWLGQSSENQYFPVSHYLESAFYVGTAQQITECSTAIEFITQEMI